MEEVRMSFNSELKQAIVAEIESGALTVRQAAERACTTITRVKMWLDDYGKFKPKKNIVEVVMKSEQDRIAELEKALAEAHLKMRVYDEILNLAGKKYKVDLKKTFGMPQSSSSELRGTKPKPSAKR